MDFKNKTVLVIGMARSGIAAAQVLRSLGASVILNDTKTEAQLGSSLDPLKGEGYIFKLGVTPDALVDMADVIVVSPSVPLNLPYAQKAKQQGKEVLAELELAFRLCKAPCVAITGTNGKTTTTTLTGQMFMDANRGTFVVGNIGNPYITYSLQAKPEDTMVCEVSSYQLEGITDFGPKAAALLNITPDHLDRHKTMENYIDTKKRIFMNQTPEDYAVLNYDDITVRNMAEALNSKVLFFSSTQKLDEGIFIENDAMVYNFEGIRAEIIPIKDIRIKGRHNLENAMAATAIAMVSGILPESIAKTLRDFKGVEHRIETVRCVNGITYINDSKGTNPDSTIKAIQTMDKPTVLILGGYDKHGEFDELIKEYTSFIKHTVVMGATRHIIEKALLSAGYKDYTVVDGDLKAAVDTATQHAQEGWNVLLSPACASFDMFADFEERGRVFKQIVNELKEK